MCRLCFGTFVHSGAKQFSLRSVVCDDSSNIRLMNIDVSENGRDFGTLCLDIYCDLGN